MATYNTWGGKKFKIQLDPKENRRIWRGIYRETHGKVENKDKKGDLVDEIKSKYPLDKRRKV